MDKLEKLKQILRGLKRVVIAYSGGVDSAFLLKMAVDTLGCENVLAVTARSETYPSRELKEARVLAKKIGARHRIIRTSELGIRGFKDNPANRCYYCKKELFKKLRQIADAEGFRYCLDGTNYDDLKDIRYGRIAAKESGVRSPLLEARITKADIRRFSKTLNLKSWDKPSFACLASRFPYGSRITRAGLSAVDAAEEFLRYLGITQVRVRHYGKLARIEVLPKEMGILFGRENSKRIARKFQQLGFLYTTADLEGYKTGSMNKALK